VHGGAEAVVAPAAQRVPGVDHEGPRLLGHVDPPAIEADLQAGHRVGGQQGHEPGVAVRVDAPLVGVGRYGRVVREPQRGQRRIEERVEVIGRHPGGEGVQREQPVAQAVHLLVVPPGGVTEAG
jgi:hypothetical protein